MRISHVTHSTLVVSCQNEISVKRAQFAATSLAVNVLMLTMTCFLNFKLRTWYYKKETPRNKINANKPLKHDEKETSITKTVSNVLSKVISSEEVRKDLEATLGERWITGRQTTLSIAFQSTILLLGTWRYSPATMDVEFKNLSKYWLRGFRGNCVVVSLPAIAVYFVSVGRLKHGENSVDNWE